MIKRLDWEILIKVLVLLGFSLFYLSIIINKKIILYVHPRNIPFIIFGMIAMALISLFLMQNIFVNKKRKIRISSCIIYILPLLMAFSIQGKSMNSDMLQNKYINLNQESNNTNSNNNSSSKNEIDSKKEQLNIEKGIIIVESENFLYSIDEISTNIEDYEDMGIQITGFIYKNKSFKENKFVIARFMMTCCTADMQVIGLLCECKDTKVYKNDTWIKAVGKLGKVNYKGKKTAVIHIDAIESISKPDNEYVYPF